MIAIRVADHIPFVNTEKDCEILRQFYPDATMFRLSLDGLSRTAQSLPTGVGLWLDPAVDGLERWPDVSEAYRSYVSQFGFSDKVGDRDFQSRPDKQQLKDFVYSILDFAVGKLKPDWLSVPQLPTSDDSSRNKIHRQMAECTAAWKSARRFGGKLILPLVLTHQRQVNRKTERNQKVALAKTCYELAGADGIWVVESSLSDQDGSRTFEETRFPGLISLHQELTEALPKDAISIAGPYWGMNLILWTRGLVTYPAIGLGNCYQYHLPGALVKAGKNRIALPPLKRWAVISAQLENWLRETLRRIPPEDDAYTQFSGILRSFNRLLTSGGRYQVARFYKDWLSGLTAVPRVGRALALYQEFSSAYVLGKGLPELPQDEGPGRRPERVAQQFMLSCL